MHPTETFWGDRRPPRPRTRPFSLSRAEGGANDGPRRGAFRARAAPRARRDDGGGRQQRGGRSSPPRPRRRGWPTTARRVDRARGTRCPGDGRASGRLGPERRPVPYTSAEANDDPSVAPPAWAAPRRPRPGARGRRGVPPPRASGPRRGPPGRGGGVTAPPSRDGRARGAAGWSDRAPLGGARQGRPGPTPCRGGPSPRGRGRRLRAGAPGAGGCPGGPALTGGFPWSILSRARPYARRAPVPATAGPPFGVGPGGPRAPPRRGGPCRPPRGAVPRGSGVPGRAG